MPPSFSGLALACAALIAGALVPLQAVSNAMLGRALGHPLWATLASLLVSIAALVPVLLVARAPQPLLGQIGALPPWAWLGGMVGMIFVSAALFLTPRLGATGFITCVIAGQMLTSLLLDHFGLMGLPVKGANAGRLFGVALIFIGTMMVQWSSASNATR